MMLLSENGASPLGGHSETSHTVGSHLLLLRKVAAKVVRPGSDQGSRYTDEDRSEETEDRALIPAITFFFGHEDDSITIVSRSQILVFRMRVWHCKTTITKQLMTSCNARILIHDGG